MDYTITFTGIDELIKKCNDPTVLGDPLRGFLMSALIIQRDVQSFTPVDTGRLRASITYAIDESPIPTWSIVTTTVQPHYAKDVEYGTAPHWPPVTKLRGWAKRHGINAYLVGRKIAKYGTRPHYMFKQAVEANMGNIQVWLKEAAAAIEANWSAK